jgi:hypothetical protein
MKKLRQDWHYLAIIALLLWLCYQLYGMMKVSHANEVEMSRRISEFVHGK